MSQILKWILGVLFIVGVAIVLDDILGLLPFTTGLILTAELFLYILLFNRPVWALATIIVVQLTRPGYMFTLGAQMVSANLIWAIMTLLLLVPILRKKGGIELGSRAKRIIVPAIILSSLAIIANFLNTDQTITFKYLRQEFVWLVILFLLPAVVKNERDLKRLALVALITCSVSAIFALRQWFIPDLRDDLEGRMIGLTTNPTHLGYSAPLVLLPTVAVLFLKGVNSLVRKLLMLLIIIMALGLYLTFTRVGIYSLVPGLLLMILLMKGKPKKELFLVTLILGVVFLFYTYMDENRYSQGFTSEGSAAGRLVLWQAGVNVAMDNPIFGIGAYQFRETSLEYTSTVDPDLMENMGAGATLGLHEAHNDFITIWASFGTLALLAYLWLLINIFRNFTEASRHSRTRFLKAFTIGCSGAMVAYIVNSATHNMVNPTMLLWIMGGLSIAATKIALSNQGSKVNRVS